MVEEKIALVTGGNKGIGFEVVRQLAARGFRVLLTARDPEAGKAALAKVSGDVQFIALDVSDDACIHEAAGVFGKAHDHLDVLINNAGIYADGGANVLSVTRQHLVTTFQTNVFGALRVTQEFLPFLRKADGARVINVSSGYGKLNGLSSDVPAYCLSKLALNGVTIMLNQALQTDGIAVNSVDPGWVRTSMGGPTAQRSVEQGADTIVWLASEAPPNLSGKFLYDRREVSW